MKCESSAYLAVQAVESTDQNCLDGQPKAMSSGKNIRKKSSPKELKTESSMKPQYSAMSEHSLVKGTPENIEAWLTSLPVDFPVSPSVLQEKEKPAKIAATCGRRQWTLSRQSSHPLCSLRTYQDCSAQQWTTNQGDLFSILEQYSETWPKAGTMSNGVCWELIMSEQSIIEKGCGYLPTPRANRAMSQNLNLPSIRKNPNPNLETVLSNYFIPTPGANENKGSSQKRFKGSKHYRGAKTSEALRTCKQDPIYLNPLFAEFLMAWPLGATDLKPLEMDNFHSQWLAPMRFYLTNLFAGLVE